jgi:glycosyltransferase involved in cell wall biosynthesis
VFWGEAPGFLLPRRIGSVYRKIMFPEINRSIAPIWGIGTWAIEGYRQELGKKNRLFLNIPYFSNLNPFLSIGRDHTSSHPCRFLFSGSFVSRKGVDLLVEAFVELVGMGSDAEFHLLGDGPLKGKLQSATSAIADRVHFHGFRQRDELPAFYANADILCAPSLYDGWGLIVPEGLAAGMLVISTTKTGSARDLVTPDCGWLIPANDRKALLDAMMRAAVLPPSERKVMSMQARLIGETQHIKAGIKQFCKAVEMSLCAWNTDV